MRRRKNPAKGTHPDLFGGETKVFRPLSDFTAKELGVMPRSAFSEAEWAELAQMDFSDDEWDALGEDIQTAIYERDGEITTRLAAAQKEFGNQQESIDHPDEAYLEEQASDDFGAMLGDESDARLLRKMGDTEDYFEVFQGQGYSDEQISAALVEALRDVNNHTISVDTGEYGSAFMRTTVSNGGVYVDRDRLRELFGGLPEDVIEYMIDEINKEVDFKVKLAEVLQALKRGWELSIEVDNDIWCDLDPDQDKILAAMKESLGEPEGGTVAETPPEERILHRYQDGSYVVDLLPSELKAESKELIHCVGQERYGYGRAIRAGETKILSLRRSNGERQFTIEAKLRDGKVVSFEQVKGTRNRPPGFQPPARYNDPPVGKVKPYEVGKIVVLAEKLGVDPTKIDDLKPAIAALEGKLVHTNPSPNWHCGFCKRRM
jgi:hypothetical protein